MFRPLQKDHNSGHHGLIVNLTRRPVLSTMAISLVVSPPRLRPIACLSADSSGGQPLFFCASAVLVDLGKCPVHHNGLQVEVLRYHVEDSLENAGLRPAPEAPVHGVLVSDSLARSRQGAPVRVIQIIPSSDIRLLLPLRLGVPGLPGKAGSISRHCLSVRISLTSNPVPPTQQVLEVLQIVLGVSGIASRIQIAVGNPALPCEAGKSGGERLRLFLAGIAGGWLAGVPQ